MGRVSRYKKIKSCDPFYKGPRKESARLDNLAPEDEDDQPVPKSVIRLMKSQSRSRNGTSKHNGGPGKNTKSGQSQEEPMFQRKMGEGLKEYLDRVDVESNARIMDCYRKSRKISDKRKKYLEERKQKFKNKKKPDPHLEFSDLKDEVHFREVVSAPPKLSTKPRGSQRITQDKGKALLLKDKLTTSNGKPKAEVFQGLKRKRDLEIERDRVIEQYRQIKKQYRQIKKAKVSRTSDSTLVL